MAGLAPAIHLFSEEEMDALITSAHDDGGFIKRLAYQL